MLNWLRGMKRTGARLPHYSSLESTPCHSLPDELMEKERSGALVARYGAIERELLEGVRRPPDDAPLFIELMVADQSLLSIGDSERDGQCLLTFGTPFRAADYVRTLLPSAPVQYVASSPSQLVSVLGDLEESGVDGFTIDRCPRCPAVTKFLKIRSSSMRTPADVLMVWATGESIQLARAELYLGHALELARNGHLDAARDIALESVGHVIPEDPGPHLLLGQLAVVLRDRLLLQEAKNFLHYFGFVPWERKLEKVERLGTLDFSGPE